MNFTITIKPIGAPGTILAATDRSEPVTLAEPPTVLPQQETPPSVSAQPTTSPASTPSAPEPPPVISPQRSGPSLLRTQSDEPSYPPLSSPSPLSVLRLMKTKSCRTKVTLVHHTSSGHRNEDFWLVCS
uniref:Uncharacterized protein n=1 Tax=Magallana gigas TaxID=29159 RepID=A0A8W8M238_MAGGI